MRGWLLHLSFYILWCLIWYEFRFDMGHCHRAKHIQWWKGSFFAPQEAGSAIKGGIKNWQKLYFQNGITPLCRFSPHRMFLAIDSWKCSMCQRKLADKYQETFPPHFSQYIGQNGPLRFWEIQFTRTHVHPLIYWPEWTFKILGNTVYKSPCSPNIGEN